MSLGSMSEETILIFISFRPTTILIPKSVSERVSLIWLCGRQALQHYTIVFVAPRMHGKFALLQRRQAIEERRQQKSKCREQNERVRGGMAGDQKYMRCAVGSVWTCARRQTMRIISKAI